MCKVVELQTQFFLPEFVLANPPGNLPKMVSQNSIFSMTQARMLVFFLISADISQTNSLTYSGGAIAPGTPQMDPPKINFLNGLTWGVSLY